MAIPAINVLGNPNVTEGNFQVAIEDLRKSVIGSGKAYDAANTYSQYDTCVSGGVVYYSKIDSNTGNTPTVGTNWGLIGDLIASVGIGYRTGAGGTATQATSKGTPVTLNKPTGKIITASSSLAANSSVIFAVNNILVEHGDLVVVKKLYDEVSPEYYRVECAGGGSGAFLIRITNITGSPLSDAIAINFAIIKGAIE